MEDLLPPGGRVLCAVSGGVDSVCLLHWLSRQQGITLLAAHVNHQLRGEESDRDEAFVRRLCGEWGIPLTVGRGDVAAFTKEKGLSLEEGARRLRYDFLYRTAEETGCCCIAVAHNADDNAETVLLNLIRGTGLKGLGGISPVQGRVIRPLLPCPRRDIEAYLEEHHLPHVEDSTNADVHYTRNKLRHQVIPLLSEINPRAVEHINAAAARLAEADQCLEQEAGCCAADLATGPGWASLPWDSLSRVAPPLRPRMVLLLLDRIGVGRKDFGAIHLEAVLRLEEGRSIDLPHQITACRRDGRLFLERRACPLPRLRLEMGRPLRWGSYTLTLLEHPAGRGLLIPAGGTITVAPCPAQARLTLSGANGPRTLKRLCRDRNIPPQRRDRLPALYADGCLAAVWPLGSAEAALSQRDAQWGIQIQGTEKDDET